MSATTEEQGHETLTEKPTETDITVPDQNSVPLLVTPKNPIPLSIHPPMSELQQEDEQLSPPQAPTLNLNPTSNQELKPGLLQGVPPGQQQEIRWTLVPLSLLPTYYQNLATYIQLNNNGQKPLLPNTPRPTSIIPPPGMSLPPGLSYSVTPGSPKSGSIPSQQSPIKFNPPLINPPPLVGSPLMVPQGTSGVSRSPQTIQIVQHVNTANVTSANLPILYRNVFHILECRLPTSPDGLSSYEGYRVFIDESVGYSGNAKLFKSKADTGERALVLSCQVLNPEHRQEVQCSFCKEYFSSRMYFKTNPHIRGRIVLIKNNQLIKVENGAFSINVKFMCCCKHHFTTNYILSLTLRDNITENIVSSASVLLYVKQWRKSTQKKNSYTIKFDPM